MFSKPLWLVINLNYAGIAQPGDFDYLGREMIQKLNAVWCRLNTILCVKGLNIYEFNFWFIVLPIWVSTCPLYSFGEINLQLFVYPTGKRGHQPCTWNSTWRVYFVALMKAPPHACPQWVYVSVNWPLSYTILGISNWYQRLELQDHSNNFRYSIRIPWRLSVIMLMTFNSMLI